jgi:hypothetical protein
MKKYLCKLCMDLYPDFCVAYVPDATPNDFDKHQLDVMCWRRERKRPLWWRREEYEMP